MKRSTAISRSFAATFAGAIVLWAAIRIGAQTVPPPAPIETVPVIVKKLERFVALPADLLAYQSVAIYPKVSGFVESISVDRGSWVKPGQTIALLAAPEIESQQLEAEAKTRRIESQRAEAEAKLAALEAALAAARANRAASQSNLTGAEATTSGAQATVTGAEATVTGGEAGLAGARSALAGAEASLANAQTTYDRLKKASETPGVVAGNELDSALKSVEVQRAAVEAQKAAVEGQRAHVAALRSALEAQRSSASAQQAGIQTQQANVEAQQAIVQAQEAGIAAQRSAVEALRYEGSAAEAAAAVVKAMREYLRVAAPFAGVITERNAHPGSLVGPGANSTSPLVRIDDIAKLRLTVSIPEAYVGAIGNGVKVTFTTPAYPDETFRGAVLRQAHALDPKTRAMAVEIDVDNPGARLFPGMFATVNWPVTRSAASYFVPPSAIVNTTEKTFVIAARDGVAVWVDVRRGISDGALMEVFGALRPNDVVVKRGIDEIRNGTKITVK